MKSFMKAITITIVLNLLLAGSTTAQTAPAPAPTAPAAAPATPPEAPVAPVIPSPPAVSTVDDALSRLRAFTLLNIATTEQYGGGNVLVIPTAEIMPQDMVTMMEDMNVMCRIFDKKLAESHLIPEMSLGSRGRLTMALSQGSRSIEAMYVQGYGALFLTKVDFPLSPPPKAQEEKETKEEDVDVDPVWEQMKQEIYAPEEVGRGRSTGERQEEKYDAGKVEGLKETLIKSLKHAANIRNLKPDESVILTVTGKGSQSAGVTIQPIGRPGQILVQDMYKRTTSIVKEPSLSDIGFSSPTVLVIRAKKSDIDAFAKEQLSFDQFSQKTQLISYPYLGGGLPGEPSRFSWPEIGSSGRRAVR
ncbi:MAG: hypothetical protein WAV28_12805 [Sedimentisphaerales bacterium]